ncbi:MAG TPA: acetyltransferase [Actinocrinis sp.]|nr:acetyltransferase [Actinocrinis sp.]
MTYGDDRAAQQPRDLLIVGAGGLARETAQAVAAINAAAGPTWRLLGFLDDDPALKGSFVDGVEVLGGSELVHTHTQAAVVVCVAGPRGLFNRARLVQRLDLPEERYATIVHPSVDVSPSSTVGPGSVLFAQTVLTASVRVGAHVAVMPQVVLTHDVLVEDFVTIASGVRLGGGTRLERGAYLGAGALIREYVTVGAWSLVGMGSVVLRDVPTGEVWVGSPAGRLRATDVPADLAAQPAAAAAEDLPDPTPAAAAPAAPSAGPRHRAVPAFRPPATERTEA